MGVNPLDPTVRTPVALAGQRQGVKLAKEIAAFWS